VDFLRGFLEKHALDQSFNRTASQWFDPLAETLSMNQNGAKRPYFVGINGCQGSGKSTLADYLQLKFTHQGLDSVVISLDDFYYASDNRLQLAKHIHPLLKTRGVPGTHNTPLIYDTLSRLKSGQPVTLPRFDKATDNPLPKDQWLHIEQQTDIVIMEGWCWGISAQIEDQLNSPINTLEEQQDPEGIWRHYVNQQLTKQYQPLYDFFDYWLMLKAPSFDIVFQWRREQEQKLIDRLRHTNHTNKPNKTMSDAELKHFIQHYQRLTEHGLKTFPSQCDQVLHLDAQRQISHSSSKKVST
jgi:D-glycerate 3-kinase